MQSLLFLPLFVLPLGPKPDALELFRKWCRSQSPELRIQAVHTLRGHIGRESRVALLSLLADPHPAVRAAVRGALVARPPDEGPALFGRLGRAAAELHEHAAQWQPPAGFTRRRWDAGALMGPDPLWGRFWEAATLDAAHRDLFRRARAVLLE